ncbi:MAG: biopolymer transporter ExbD [Kiritimatiellae bacterium]|jgi:biopolymer transport protein ExbD|nr:biopolymer transporter ExbD [Kiritimatiellia bacterium]
MAYERKRNKGESPKLDMTPMIDVVFQLLIFFVVTIKQEDILSKLSAARPAPDSNANPSKQPDLITIIVAPQGFVFNGRLVSKDELDRKVERYSKLSKTAMIVIKCTADSPHGLLVQSLDICSKHGMTNLSIFSI